MKRRVLISFVMMMVVTMHAAQDYRHFTDNQGRTIRGRVLSFDAEKQMVKFERDNRKTASVPLSMFCDADQKYIREWGNTQSFANKAQFKISIKKYENENKAASAKLKSQTSGLTFDVEDTHYDILLENRADVSLTNLEVQYCIFYEQDSPSGEERGVLFGSVDVSSMSARSKKTLTTEAVSVYKSDLMSGYEYRSGARSLHTGDIKGVWVKVYLGEGSSKSMREHTYPKGLNTLRTWSSSSDPVGINE